MVVQAVGNLFDQFLGAAETDTVLADGSCAGSACSTAYTWFRRHGWSAGPSGTTCDWSPEKRAARPDCGFDIDG